MIMCVCIISRSVRLYHTQICASCVMHLYICMHLYMHMRMPKLHLAKLLIKICADIRIMKFMTSCRSTSIDAYN